MFFCVSFLGSFLGALVVASVCDSLCRHTCHDLPGLSSPECDVLQNNDAGQVLLERELVVVVGGRPGRYTVTLTRWSLAS